MVNAAHTFYNGTTTLPISEEDRTPRKRISKTLNMTTNPEEKRKIIGDTFVKVRLAAVAPRGGAPPSLTVSVRLPRWPTRSSAR